MRVLLVTNDWAPGVGGIETYLQGLVARTGHDIRVLAPRTTGDGPDPMVVRHPSRHRLGVGRATVDWVAHQAGEWGADVVWYGAPHPPALAARAVAERTGLPYVVHVHGAELAVAAAVPGLRGRLRRVLADAATVLSVSHHTAAEVLRLSGRPATVLGVGVDTGRFVPRDRPTPAGPLRVLCVGRLVARKGQGRLIRAAAVLAGRGVAIEVGLVGRGDDRHLRRLARRLGVPVTFEPDVAEHDLPARYRAADVFAMPVRDRWWGLDREGLGIVYLEAAASGLPVIAGYSGGAPETLLAGRTGLLASEVGEIVDALAHLADRTVAASMGEAGRSFVVEAYRWEDVIARFDAAFDH